VNCFKKYILVFSVIGLFISKADAQQFNYKVNAMYIYYFTKYINWPEPKDPVIIGVLGDSDVSKELEAMTANKRMNGRSFLIKKIDISEVKKCQVVVVSKGQSSILIQVEEATKNLPILVVSEKQGLTRKGANICIYVDDEDNFKTKFELSKGNMESKGLKVSHELLALAEVVK
jgi:hypothetical protein